MTMRGRRSKQVPKRRGRGSSSVQTRKDGWVNRASGHGTHRDRSTLTNYRADIVTDLEAMNLWRSDWIMAAVFEMLPNDACRPGFDIKIGSNGDGADGAEETKETSEALLNECERLDVLEKLRIAGQWQRAYGGAALFPVLEGNVGDLSEPLDDYLDGITHISAIHVLEPRELRPHTWYTDITNPKFRRPEIYQFWPATGGGGVQLQTALIHESRLGILPGIRITNMLMGGQRPGWGDTIASRVRDVAAKFGLAWGSVSTLLQDFAQGVLRLAGMTDLLGSKQGEELVARRVSAIDEARSVLRSMVIDKDDDFTRTSTPVTGLEGLMIQAAQLVAAAARMPVTKLMGISPAGMNATGEADTRSWYDACATEQKMYSSILKWLIKLITLQADGPCEGVEPEIWSTEWKPLWLPTDKEIAETRFLDAQADEKWVGMGAATGLDVARAHWGGDTYSRDLNVDIDALEEQERLMTTDPALTEQPQLDENGDPIPIDPDTDAASSAANDGDGKEAEVTSASATEPLPKVKPAVKAPARKFGKTVKVAAHQRTV